MKISGSERKFLVMKRFQSPKDYFGIWPSPPMWMLIGSDIQRGILISRVAKSLADWSNKYYLIIDFMIFFLLGMLPLMLQHHGQ